MTRFAFDETSQSIYRTAQLRAQLENCQIENHRLLTRVETLEREIADLTGELHAAEEELDMYEKINDIPAAPEDNEL